MDHSATPPPLLYDGPPDARWVVALAHGAGAAMDSPFMATMAGGLAAAGLRVVRFEFPYMRTRRASGVKRPPDGARTLEACWRSVIETLGGSDRLVVGGKSLGGRIASLIADDVEASGLLCLGYPFHAPGRAANPRINHLRQMRTPTLILKGTRDALGNQADVASYPLSKAVSLEWIPDGDHSFAPRKASSRTLEENMALAITAACAFVKGL